MEKKSNIIRVIISILISVGLWVYVINVVNPSSTTTVRNIPVALTGEEQLFDKGLAIVGSGEYTVDITVRASRTDLGNVSADYFSASADVSELTMGQDYITVSVNGPRGFSVEEIRSRKIQVYVDELATKTVPVEVRYSAAQSGYEAASLSVYPKTVEISGAKQLVDSVSHFSVEADSSQLTLEKESELQLTGSAVNESGAKIAGVKSSAEIVDVKACIYAVKTVALKVDYVGSVWEGAKVNSIDVPSSINIKGATENLSKISELGTKKIDISGLFEDFETGIEVKLPEGVYLAESNPDPVFRIDIADNGSIQFVYSVNEIKTVNLPETLSVVYKLAEGAHIEVTANGPVSALKSMSSSDIALSTDGSGFSAGNKDVKLSAATQVSGVTLSITPGVVNAVIRKR